MKQFGKIFLMGLMASLLIFSGCKHSVSTETETGNSNGQSEPENTAKPEDVKKPFANLTETTAHPMKYIIDFADLVDYVKGKDENVSADGILTVGNNEEYGDLNESDRQVAIKVGGMFKNNLPKAGDTIELHGKITSDIDIDNMIFMFVDSSKVADLWTRVVEDTKKLPLAVSKGVAKEFKIECPVLNDCLEGAALAIAYGKYNGGGAYAKLKFEHCTETQVEPMDAPGPRNFDILTGDDFQGIKFRINMTLPSGADSCEIRVLDAEDTSYAYTITTAATTKLVEIPYLTAGKNYYIKLNYLDAESQAIQDAKCTSRFKAESGKIFERYPNFPRTYQVDFTDYLNIIAFDENGWGDCYLEPDSEEVYGGVLKKGDRIEYTFTGKFSADISKFHIKGHYLDSEDNWQNVWNEEWLKSVEVTAGKEVTISGVVACERESVGTVIIHMYSDELKNGFFVPKGQPLPKLYEFDFTEYLKKSGFEDWGDNYGYYCDVTKDFIEKYGALPKQGDFLKYSFTGTFTADIGEISVYDNYENSSGEWITTWGNWGKSVDIKANQEITISGTAVIDMEMSDVLNFKMLYPSKYGNCQFIPKGTKEGDTYEVDLTPYMSTIIFRDDGWGWCILDGVTPEEFYGGVPKKGDKIEYTVTGKFSTDLDKLTVQGKFSDSSGAWKMLWNDGGQTVEIQANEEVTVSGTAFCEIDSLDNVIIQFGSDDLKNEYFVPKGKTSPITYEIDFTEYMEVNTSGYWDSWSGRDWYGMRASCEIDSIEVFGELPKKGDMLKYSFKGKFSTDIDVLTVLDQYESSGEWIQTWADWSKNVEIKENREVTITGTAILETDLLDTFYVNLIVGCECTFIPKGWGARTYEVDLTEYLEPKYGGYDYSFNIDASDFSSKYPLKKGDIVEFSFTGTFDKDISTLSAFLDGYDGVTKWHPVFEAWDKPVEIRADVKYKFQQTVFCKTDSQPSLCFHISYPKENGEAVFVPGNWNGEIYEVDLTPYLNNAVEGPGNYVYFDVTEAFEDMLLNKGDIIKFSFTGSFAKDIEECYCWLGFDSGSSQSEVADFIAAEPKTLSGYATVDGSPTGNFYLCLDYNSYEYGQVTFTPGK